MADLTLGLSKNFPFKFHLIFFSGAASTRANQNSFQDKSNYSSGVGPERNKKPTNPAFASSTIRGESPGPTGNNTNGAGDLHMSYETNFNSSDSNARCVLSILG